MDVSKDHLIFPPHVIRNSFLFHPAHVALWIEKQTRLWNPQETLINNLIVDFVWFHLHYRAQVSDIVSLSLHQLQKHIAEQEKSENVTVSKFNYERQ